jgi:hypothetical protein
LDDEFQARNHQNFFVLTFVTCEHSDMRQSPDGFFIYGNAKTEVSINRPWTAWGLPEVEAVQVLENFGATRRIRTSDLLITKKNKCHFNLTQSEKRRK